MSTTSDWPSHAWRSPDLGEPRTLSLEHGELTVFDRGRGPTIVFAHGWLANANLWRNVVARLVDRFRCVALDLPLGSHRVAMRDDADLTPRGCGRLITGALAAMHLRDVTLVGNDSGGAYSQIGIAADPDRVARLVLSSCETPHDTFPPAQFGVLKMLGEDRNALRQAFEPLRTPEFRHDPRAYGLLLKRPIETRVWDTYALPCLVDDGVLRDAAKAMRSASEVDVRNAAAVLTQRTTLPVLFVWSPEDPVFPYQHAETYARSLRDARVVAIPDSYGFMSEDQPARMAEAVAAFTRGAA